MNEIQITKEFLQEKNVCKEGLEWWEENCHDLPAFEQIAKVKQQNLKWCNWLITRLMSKAQCIKYAIYAAEQVIYIYEKQYPDDERPRLAIEAAKNYLKNPSTEMANAAANASYVAADAAVDAAAYAAANAAYVAADAAVDAAAYAAANAAYAAANAAYAAANAAYVAADAAANAAYAAANAAYAAANAAYAEMQSKIIDYGINLLKEKEEISGERNEHR